MYKDLNAELANLGPQLVKYLENWSTLTEARKARYYTLQDQFNAVEHLLKTYYLEGV